jgi:hypothetical protein
MPLRSLKLFLCVLLTFSSCLCVVGQSKVPVRFSSPFPFVVVHNKAAPKLDKTDAGRRFIEILISKENFTKSKLESLFNHIAGQYLEPDALFINVFSSADDLSRYKEFQPIPHLKNNQRALKGDNAICTRNSSGKRILMYFSSGEFEEVQLR